MALLNRLFSTRKKSQKSNFIVNGKHEGESWRPYAFNKEQVRVLLFRECDWRGRKLLFDSNSVQKVSNVNSSSKLKFRGRSKCDTKSTTNLSSPCNGCSYQYTKQNTDVSMLGEMIFGSVGMTFKGSAFKVHKIKSPTQLMCSKVFLSPKYHRKHLSSDRSLDDSYDSSFNSQSEAGVHRSSSDNRLTSRTGPLDVPCNDSYANLYPPAPSYLQASEEDSGFYGDASLLSVHGSTSSGFGPSSGGGTSWSSFGQSIGPISNHGSGSFQNMQRRWLRSLHTSMELFCQNPSACTCCSGPLNSGYSVDGLEENTHAAASMTSGGRRPKIGLAVLVTLLDPMKDQQADKDSKSDGAEEEKVNRESFFFEHASVVEEMLDRLKLATEKACHARKDFFIPLIMDACSELEQSLLDLFSAPRLSQPVWLGLLSQSGAGGRNHSTIALGFLEQLCQSLSNLDTKDTNFFISTLITAVLTHHLGWVQTVVPQPFSKKQPNSNGYSLESLSNSFPYNALWAQLGDLQGSLGYPPRLSRTILTGKDTQVLNSLLFVLTYFLRCGRVECSHEDGPIEEESSAVVKDVVLGKQNPLRPVVEKDNQKMLSPVHPIACIPQSKFSPPSQSCRSSCDRLLQPRAIKDERETPKGLRRTSSHVSSLGDSFSSDKVQPAAAFEPDVISEKVQRLCRVPTSAILYHLNNASSSREDTNDRNESSSDVVFVLGENEKLVGIKGRVPPVHSAEEVIAAEEVVEGSEDGKVFNEGGKVALGDQITALAGEFLSRCKEGIRLAGKAADSIGVVGGRANLPSSGRGASSPEPINGISKSATQYKGSSLVRNVNGVEDSLCSRHSHRGCKIERVTFPGDRIFSMLNRSASCYFNPKENDERTWVCVGACGEDGESVSCRSEKSRMKWSDKIRTHECDGVEEFVCGRERNSSVSTLKPEFNIEDVDDISPVIDTSELPSFDGIVTVELPMPKSVVQGNKDEECKCGMGWGLVSSLLGATTDHYIPHMVLQGIISSHPVPNGTGWENRLRRDLLLSVHYPIYYNHPHFPQEFSSSPYPITAEPEVAEAVCVLANTDTWEVQLVSSKPCLVDRPGTLGVRVGMSQLVANMLESLLVLWRLRTPPEYCLLHLESKLREIWLRSQSLAQLLLTTEFCNMARVTTALDLEANDVPLLLAVASTHTPQVALRYGLSFR